MTQQEKETGRNLKGYCSSNPNCRSVFSKSKIIRYYVCPACQTMVQIDTIGDQQIIKEDLPKEETAPYQIGKSAQIQNEELDAKEITTKDQPKASKNQEKDNKADFLCNYCFGYLGEREKGEGIPNICVECAKSLECMLSKVYQSRESIGEIKKWCHF